MMPTKVKSSLTLRGTALQRWFTSVPAVADIVDTWRNPAAVLHGINDLRVEDVPLPIQVAGGSVRVQMKSVGICGSDVHFVKKVRNAVSFSAADLKVARYKAAA